MTPGSSIDNYSFLFNYSVFLDSIKSLIMQISRSMVSVGAVVEWLRHQDGDWKVPGSP